MCYSKPYDSDLTPQRWQFFDKFHAVLKEYIVYPISDKNQQQKSAANWWVDMQHLSGAVHIVLIG